MQPWPIPPLSETRARTIHVEQDGRNQLGARQGWSELQGRKAAQRKIGSLDQINRHGGEEDLHAAFVLEALAEKFRIEKRAPAGKNAAREIDAAMRAERNLNFQISDEPRSSRAFKCALTLRLAAFIAILSTIQTVMRK